MQVKSVRIQNFRAFKEEHVNFESYTAFVGPNGAGKSTVLAALRVFFGDADGEDNPRKKLCEQDFHHRNVAVPIEITVTFHKLSKAACTELADYVRGGELVVTTRVTWDDESKSASIVQFGNRLGITAFARYFEANARKEKAAELQKIFTELRSEFPGLTAASTKADMEAALQAFEADDANRSKCELIASQDQFYGFAGTNKLSPFVQWFFVPAVKVASAEQIEKSSTVLGRLLDRTVRNKVDFTGQVKSLQARIQSEYGDIVQSQQHVLRDISTQLSNRLGEWGRPGTIVELKWESPENAVKIGDPVAKASISEGGFVGDIARTGHGCQRSYLVALLEVLAATETGGGATMVLAIEEPELYQHPPQARHLASVLERLANDNSQVMICTHSPCFVNGSRLEAIRHVRVDPTKREAFVRQTSVLSIHQKLTNVGLQKPQTQMDRRSKLHQALAAETNEIFFADIIVLVEGVEDWAYITSHLVLSGKGDEFRRLGCHMVPVGGKSELPIAIAIAQELAIPCFAILDSDGPEYRSVQEKDRAKWGRRCSHVIDNLAVQQLCNVPNPTEFPTSDLWHSDLVMWESEIESAIKDSVGESAWRQCDDEIRKELDMKEGDIKKRTLFIGHKMERLKKDSIPCPLLDQLCDAILCFGRTNANRTAIVALSQDAANSQ